MRWKEGGDETEEQEKSLAEETQWSEIKLIQLDGAQRGWLNERVLNETSRLRRACHDNQSDIDETFL